MTRTKIIGFLIQSHLYRILFLHTLDVCKQEAKKKRRCWELRSREASIVLYVGTISYDTMLCSSGIAHQVVTLRNRVSSLNGLTLLHEWYKRTRHSRNSQSRRKHRRSDKIKQLRASTSTFYLLCDVATANGNEWLACLLLWTKEAQE